MPVRINTQRILLVLDWDGTIAKTDTLSLIAPSPEALEPYTEAYMADYRALSEARGPRDTMDKMERWLEAMQQVEYDSVRRVEQGGLFRGMSREGMLARARDTSLLELQQGAVELLSSFRGRWGIVSVGWSAQFIRAALEARNVSLRERGEGEGGQPVRIAANEVVFDAATGLGTGMISKHEANSEGIRVARDKRREMRRMVDEWRAGLSLAEDGGRAEGDDEADRGTVVYVGDSETDLLCLLEADVGIIMKSPGMVDKMRALGMQVIADGEGVAGGLRGGNEDREGKKSHALYAVDDFRELLDA